MARLKVGDVAEVTGKKYGHQFRTGDHIRIVEVRDHDYQAQSLSTNERWWVKDSEILQLTSGETNVKPHRRTFKLLKDMPNITKGAYFQEECDDGTQPYALLSEDHLRGSSRSIKFSDRSIVEDQPQWFVEVFQVSPQFMTREELDQWEAFKGKPKKTVAKATAPKHEPIAELKKRGAKSKHAYLREMTVGASTTKNASERTRVASAVSMYAKQSGKKFAIAKSGANRIKITRLA